VGLHHPAIVRQHERLADHERLDATQTRSRDLVRGGLRELEEDGTGHEHGVVDPVIAEPASRCRTERHLEYGHRSLQADPHEGRTGGHAHVLSRRICRNPEVAAFEWIRGERHAPMAVRAIEAAPVDRRAVYIELCQARRDLAPVVLAAAHRGEPHGTLLGQRLLGERD
jgi:hypothetical protein